MSANGWMPVARWAGRYEVNRAGKVRRVDGFVPKLIANDQGYMMVRLSQPRRLERVHRLVAEAFIPNPAGKPVVNHLNNDRADNRVENLEWCTQAENLAHADRQGRMQRDYWVGKRSANASLSDEQVRKIRTEYADGGISLLSLGKKNGVSKRAVGRIVHLETYFDVQ